MFEGDFLKSTMPARKDTSLPFFSLGLTGGIGSGKSTVAKLLQSSGAAVIDTDEIAHSLTAPGGMGIERIGRVFGPDYVSKEGSLDRAKMRELVFRDPSARKTLEGILHPLIWQESVGQAARQKGSYSIFVIPLLAEQPAWQTLVDRILVVDCPEELQISRVMERNNMSLEQVRAIMATQATRLARVAIADDVILNDGSLGDLSAEIARLDAQYRIMAEKYPTKDA